MIISEMRVNCPKLIDLDELCIKVSQSLMYSETYAEMERHALSVGKRVIEWMNAKTFLRCPVMTNEIKQAIEGLFEVMLWHRGGIRELFYRNREYRGERVEGSPGDTVLLELSDILLDYARERGIR